MPTQTLMMTEPAAARAVQLSDLQQQRRAAQICLRMRREAGLKFSPVVIFWAGDRLTMTPAIALRADLLSEDAIVEIVDIELPVAGELPALLEKDGGWVEPVLYVALVIGMVFLFELLIA